MEPLIKIAVFWLVAVMPLGAFGQRGQDKFFNSNGVRIHYVEQGTGEPVVLVHGYANSAEKNWITSGVFDQLAKNYRVIAIDCRGHGKSEKPHDPSKYGQETILDVIRLLDHLRIDKTHIVGYSMGGTITAILLTIRPERFLTATFGGSSIIRPPATDEAKQRREKMAAEMEQGGTRALILSEWPPDESPPTDEQLKQYAANRLSGQDLKALAAHLRGGGGQVVSLEQFAAVTVPLLAIVGSVDSAMAGVNKVKAAISRLKVVTIERATHSGKRAAYNRPEFVQALREFLKSASAKKIAIP